jgi:hypothetical protein
MAKVSMAQQIIDLAHSVIKECDKDAEMIANHSVVRVHYRTQTPRWKAAFKRALGGYAKALEPIEA